MMTAAEYAAPQGNHPQNDNPWNTRDVIIEGLPGYLFRSFRRTPEYSDLQQPISRGRVKMRYDDKKASAKSI